MGADTLAEEEIVAEMVMVPGMLMVSGDTEMPVAWNTSLLLPQSV